ncbi:hydrogenase expression/formation protein [Patescibacteria group bacterium]|nr:hydrogenase expression/formation protein [Patescibacteria group bacterium]
MNPLKYDSEQVLPSGKINPEILQKFFSLLPFDKTVIVGPQIGEDAAVIEFEGKYLVVKTDPITLTSQNLGWYAVNINANDVACMGATPCWFLLTILLPQKKVTRTFLNDTFSQLLSASKELKVTLVGGHIEVTSRVSEPIAIGQMIGKVSKDKLIRTSGAKVGDVILLTKGIAIEGTNVIYQGKKEELKGKVSASLLKSMENLLYTPGISVVKEALLANEKVKVHCMHDPTEGGLKAGLWEIAYASGTGIRVKREKIPILRETKILCDIYKLDPLGLLASGALILTLDSEEAKKLLNLYQKEGIKCASIGEVVSKKEGLSIVEGSKNYPFSAGCRDELSKIF